jgi:hypothetical protein
MAGSRLARLSRQAGLLDFDMADPKKLTLIENVTGGVALVAVGAHAEFFEAEVQTS